MDCIFMPMMDEKSKLKAKPQMPDRTTAAACLT